MGDNFTTSVNILRDTDRDFNYIPTPNAAQVVSQMVNDFKKGIRSFSIVGTYGTGKSSFLLALEQSIRGRKRYFEPNFVASPNVDFIKIVGSYTSVIDYFSDVFDVTTNKNRHENILSQIFNHYHSLGKNNAILFLILDEFGKFLEYASKHNPENELYFIQQLAEFCSNPRHNIVLITTIHQSFESYAYSLNGTQKQEWTKVKGRFREITFNEPVEQLLHLASEHVSRNNCRDIPEVAITDCLKISSTARAFSLNNDFADQIAKRLYPLDILAANVLTLSLQKYGQNERSLFTFLESTDHTGLAKFDDRENPFYNLSCVYDYLNFNFYSFLTSKYNPDFSAWISIRTAIENIERSYDTSINNYMKVVKTIGLLNIFSANGANLDRKFLSSYLFTACGVPDSKKIVDDLESKKIIRYRSHNNRFILFEGTDLDIETALREAGNKISEVGDVTSFLKKYFHFNPVFAKQYSYEKGTPRFFEFRISEYPIVKEAPNGEVDGFINLIFNDKISALDIQKESLAQKEAIVYCFFKNSLEIKNLLFEIEKIQRVIEENKDDKVAKRELENIVDAQIRLLNHYISDSMYTGAKDVKWFFKGEEKKIADKKDFNKLLSQICNSVYNATPIFKNELLNRHRISASIHTAKKNFFKALVNSWNEENLGFEDSKFPPEKTIYLSLLKENGIAPAHENSSLHVASINNESSFKELWNASERFLESGKASKRNISDFVAVLSKRPLKLKQGLIDFWIPTFLFLKRNDCAVFNEGIYLPNLSEENLELISKYPGNYDIKTFDIAGVKLDIFNSYRTFLSQSTQLKFDNNSFIETIKPFISFYKQLPQYSKQTRRLSPAALKIRQAIVSSKDPEQTFFEAFPDALGVSLNSLRTDKSKLQAYTVSLQNAVKELRTSYDALIRRFEEYICSEFLGELVGFEQYKEHLQNRFLKLKRHLLLSNQKTFVQRVDSALDDKVAWLNSLAQSVVGRTLDMFSDDDEILLYEKFKSMILELDSLTTISTIDIDEKNEEVIGVKIDTFFSTINPKIVRIPKSKAVEVDQLKSILRTKLGSDKTANLAAVLNLLKDLLQ